MFQLIFYGKVSFSCGKVSVSEIIEAHLEFHSILFAVIYQARRGVGASAMTGIFTPLVPGTRVAADDDAAYGALEGGSGGQVSIELRDLEVIAPTASGPKTLLDKVTCSLLPGEVTAVLGPSGAGKTSLVPAISALVVGACTRATVAGKGMSGRADCVASMRKAGRTATQRDLCADRAAAPAPCGPASRERSYPARRPGDLSICISSSAHE